MISKGAEGNEEVTSVFIPAAPNPTYGFMVMTKLDELTLLDLKVDEAMKFVVSCGVVIPNSNHIPEP
jgi:uncharacterized membrane protein